MSGSRVQRASPADHGRRDATPTVDLAAVRRICVLMDAGGVFGLTCAIFGPDPRPDHHGAFAILIACELAGVAALLIRSQPTLAAIRLHLVWMAATICVRPRGRPTHQRRAVVSHLACAAGRLRAGPR